LVNFDNESWGLLETEQFSIEFNMGNDDLLDSFILHIRGNDLALPVIVVILEKLDLKAANGRDNFFFDIKKSKESIKAWINYKNEILNQ